MRKGFLLTAIIIVCFCFSSAAQVYVTKTIHSGESIPDVSSYLFPSFTDATVKLKNGGRLTSKLNFNLLISDMQFIGPDNDTLSITNADNIDSILLNNAVFFFNQGYYEIVASADTVKLAILRKTTYQAITIGALGLPNHTGTGIKSYTSFLTYVGEKKLVMNEDIEATSETTYYLITNGTVFNKANKTSFIKVFPGKEKNIQAYLKQAKTDFNKQADLEKLFQFCLAPN